MKLLIDHHFAPHGRFHSIWEEAGYQVTCEYGVMIKTQYAPSKDSRYIEEIWYEVKGHRFECLKDVRKALEMKVLL
jgi:hypothetical protein